MKAAADSVRKGLLLLFYSGLFAIRDRVYR